MNIETPKRRYLAIFVMAFALNLIWEHAHSVLYYLPSGAPITEWRLLRATLFDAAFITLLGVIFTKVRYFRDRKWYALLFGFIAAFLLENYALATGRWAYNDLMPIIPVLQTGLTPTLQLGILSFVLFHVFDRRKAG